ncbi:MAG: hypothetical protein REI78_12660 [Pedobacter sp.]|nr:hypothetical protein [Pedobacter sp.]MDQ8053877.1 hypothetical protein [Pedobacter sp.]
MLTFGLFCSAQEHKEVDSVLNIWIKKFNTKKYDELYQLHTSFYRSKMPLEQMVKNLEMVRDMMGVLKSAKFVAYKNQVYTYLVFAKENHVVADVNIVYHPSDKAFQYLAFNRIGGTDDPPPAAIKQ